VVIEPSRLLKDQASDTRVQLGFRDYRLSEQDRIFGGITFQIGGRLGMALAPLGLPSKKCGDHGKGVNEAMGQNAHP
jgi:hypothetical protein